MPDSLTFAFAQINSTVGDVVGNIERVRDARAKAAAAGADLMVTGELVVAGYPPEDLVLKRSFQRRIVEVVEAFAAETDDGGPAVLLGAPWRTDGCLRNAALLIEGGRIVDIVVKTDLPNYGVFDEKRLFVAGVAPRPIEFRGVRLGAMICEDMWTPDVARPLAEAGAEMLIVMNGSPYESDKPGQRIQLARERAGETGLPLAYVNLIGGQDELVFDGESFVVAANGELLARAPAWKEHLLVTEWRRESDGWHCRPGEIAEEPSDLEAIYRAMTLGLRDYVNKNGFPGVVIGMSGGIDSALTAAVAVDALGADRVLLIAMPSPYTSPESVEDAESAAKLLGTKLESVSIEPAMGAFGTMLAGLFAGRPPNEAEENIQARARGLTLMAVSNKFGHMLVTTGNKSEMSVGYATIYGDMCGGYSVLKDIYKTTVFALSRWRNAHRPDDAMGPEGRVVPERIITKPPSAELKPDQTDQDTLPPYEILDGILQGLVEEEMAVADVAARGYDETLVRRIWRMLDRAEYKRRQAPPGVKITTRAFGRDRRYPITNRFTNLV